MPSGSVLYVGEVTPRTRTERWPPALSSRIGIRMSAIIMDGREVGRRLRPELERYARELKQRQHRARAWAAVLIGDDPASRQYVRNKRRFAEELGFESRMLTMTA